MLWLICLYVSGIKDTTWETAAKNGPEIRTTMAKSTNGQNNTRGKCMLPWDGSYKVVAKADSDKIRGKWFIFALLAWSCTWIIKKRGKKNLKFTWFMSRKKADDLKLVGTWRNWLFSDFTKCLQQMQGHVLIKNCWGQCCSVRLLLIAEVLQSPFRSIKPTSKF